MARTLLAALLGVILTLVGCRSGCVAEKDTKDTPSLVRWCKTRVPQSTVFECAERALDEAHGGGRRDVLPVARELEAASLASLRGTPEEHDAALGTLAILGTARSRDALLVAGDRALAGDNAMERTLVGIALLHTPKHPRAMDLALSLAPSQRAKLDFVYDNFVRVVSNACDARALPWLLEQLRLTRAELAKLEPSSPATAGLRAYVEELLTGALLVMRNEDAPLVTAELRDASPALRRRHDESVALLASCAADVACWIRTLGESHRERDPRFVGEKGSAMICAFGSPSVVAELLPLATQDSHSVRVPLVHAIDKLLPRGDVSVADTLERIVRTETTPTAGDAGAAPAGLRRASHHHLLLVARALRMRTL